MRTRLRDLCIPAAAVGLLLLDAPRVTASACSSAACLSNSATIQRVDPTSITTDTRGDATFFASQVGQLPNVVFVIDNSSSMYELPFDVNTFPNSAWVSKGATPVTSTTARFDDPTNVTGTATGCHSNTFFESLRDRNGRAYDKNTRYSPIDPAFASYFDNTKAYRWFDWASTTAPAGFANGTDPAVPASDVPAGSKKFPATGAASGACTSSLSSAAGSGGTFTDSLGRTYTLTQQQRCQQCIDEAGYYIMPNSSTTTGATATEGNVGTPSGKIVFSGNWLNFYPPKFLIARKVLTDFIASQTTSPTPVRIGVVTYDPQNANGTSVPKTSLQPHDGGHFISSGMLPGCGITTWSGISNPTNPADSTTAQGKLIQAVRGITWSNADGSPIATPLAETLFNVGEFYSGSDAKYKSLFTSGTWTKAEFLAPTDASKPLCAACQTNAIVLITDGAPQGDNNLPAPINKDLIECTGATPTAEPPVGCGVDALNGTPNLLDDVTNFLATTDLNDALPGTQNVVTYVIGLGLKVPLLDNAAKFGKSSGAIRADSAADLEADITGAVVSIVARSTAFSSTAIQTLEVGNGSSAFVPRFLPGPPTDPIWEGHLFRFDLFNEFTAGVDKNGDGSTEGVFLVDKDGDIVTEDDTGAFHKQTCGASGCTIQGPAVPFWDAGQVLQAAAASKRTIYTAVQSGGNNSWRTIAWPTAIDTSNTSDFQLVKAALNLAGTTACTVIKGKMATPFPSRYLDAGSQTFGSDQCALAIMDFVRGLNVLNEVTTVPAGVTDTTTLNRPHMLGDIFHSSPVMVEPPVDQFLCALGLDTQCVSTLFQDSTGASFFIPSETTTVSFSSEPKDAYEKYWEDHESRQRVVIVGANDGMLHAFDAGAATANPPVVTAPVLGLRTVAYSNGDGHEVWGFVSPDQLPRLWLMMRDGHQISMDGDIMVRDVWVDGKANDKAGGYTNQPGVKQAAEYHTIAIASERQGGTHYVALDLTDTTKPQMLWMYPPPCDSEEQAFGETWGQFSPRPPPIGPVLLQTTNTAFPAFTTAFPHVEERWVAFLNGGHSPYDDRGRALAMVDVYTGAPLFVANFNPRATDATKSMRFGFPATVSMVDYTSPARYQDTSSRYEQDGFFDAAVVGDEGGQLWTVSFAEPGLLDTNGLATNWTLARAYSPNKTTPDDARFHQAIYTSAGLTVDGNNWLRAYFGSGDRAHIRSTGGGDCRADDPMSCILLGCKVQTSFVADNGPNHFESSFVSAATTSATAPAIGTAGTNAGALLSLLGSTGPTAIDEQFSSTTGSCSNVSVTQAYTVNCGTNDARNFSNNNLTFSNNGSSATDSTIPTPPPDDPRNVAVPSPLTDYKYPNTFASVVVFGQPIGPLGSAVPRLLSVPAEAAAYDTARFNFFGTTPDLVDVTTTSATSSAVTGSVGAATGPGWIVRYVINNTVPVVSNGTQTFIPASVDEKTATSASIQGGCVLWSTIVPNANTGTTATTGSTAGCASAGSTVAPFYQADAITGAPNCAASFLGAGGAASTSYVRFLPRNVLSPPPEPAPTVSVASGGTGIRYSTLEIQPGAGEVTQMTVRTNSDLLQMVYSLPLTLDQHTCRHVDANKCE